MLATRLKSERDRRAAMEARAITVITSSSALISLIFALVAILVGKDYKFMSGAKVIVVIALVIFAVSALCALFAGQLRTYKVPSQTTLLATLNEHWADSEVDAVLACSYMDYDTLLSLRLGNDHKAWWLDQALRSQLGAGAVLTLAVVDELLHVF